MREHIHKHLGCEGTLTNGDLVIRFPSCISQAEYEYICEMFDLMKGFAKRQIFKGRYEPRFGCFFEHGKPLKTLEAWNG